MGEGVGVGVNVGVGVAVGAGVGVTVGTSVGVAVGVGVCVDVGVGAREAHAVSTNRVTALRNRIPFMLLGTCQPNEAQACEHL